MLGVKPEPAGWGGSEGVLPPLPLIRVRIQTICTLMARKATKPLTRSVEKVEVFRLGAHYHNEAM